MKFGFLVFTNLRNENEIKKELVSAAVQLFLFDSNEEIINKKKKLLFNLEY